MNFRSILFFSIILSLLSCNGCARINMEVTTYYNPSLQLAGKTYAFYSIAKLHQDRDNQYDYFTDLMAQKFSLIGMKKTAIFRADYRIVLYYWIGKGKTKIKYEPLIGQIGSELKSSYSNGTALQFGNFGHYNEHTTYNRSSQFMELWDMNHINIQFIPISLKFIYIRKKVIY